MSRIDSSILCAYLQTDYCVASAEPFVLRVGIASTPLEELYARHRTNCCAFVTACNPHSRLVDDNTERQEELARELQRRGLTFFEGIGRHPAGGWPAEASFLVLGLSLADAKKLGEEYEQNAILWCGPDTIPELVILG